MTSENAISLRHQRYLCKMFEVRTTENVSFGIAGVDWTPAQGALRFRPLLLDIYEPDEAPTALRPALILAFGGAFQRGTRKNDVVGELPHRNSAISEYCREFARRGYVCFAIDYRLMPEAPDPGITPTWIPGTSINVDRANFVRDLLGLHPCTQQMMIDEIEAATDDVSTAVEFVHSRCRDMMIDPDRIALGGFSAGGTIAVNSAFAQSAKVAAVVALSGRMSIESARSYVPGAQRPSLLMVFGENDLAGTLEDLETRTRYFDKVQLAHEVVHIKGATHFYPRTSEVTRKDGSLTDLETRLEEFLYKHLKLEELMK
jgi:dienelactone hydrolase